MRVLFASAEVSPIAKTGGLGDVCGSLPKALAALGHDVVVFMPYYRQAHDWLAKNGVTVTQLAQTTISWANWPAEATFLGTTLPGTNIPLILVANDYFFDREQLYSVRADGFDDSLHRYTFFCRAIIRGCELLGIHPEIVHAHDWHTALLPVYLHSGLRGSANFSNARSVYTIHNLNYQGNAAPDALAVTGLHSRYWAPDALEHFGQVNAMKGGIIFADRVTTVSPHYAWEMQGSEHGAGLDGLLRILSHKLGGIVNGIDVEEWNPATDVLLPAHFSPGDLRGKAFVKEALAKEARLPYEPHRPILSVVSRLVDQKGFQLLLPILDRLLEGGAQAVILGSGEPHYEEAFRHFARRYPERCSVRIGFDNALAHRIYAGSDMLLMPSMYEPCGLNQMYALHYGTIPIVRLTGGLVDTVVPFDGGNAHVATGFGFHAAHPEALFTAAWNALLTFRDGHTWSRLQQNGMHVDFSWERSAREYVATYEAAVRQSN
jgi:starch synthase